MIYQYSITRRLLFFFFNDTATTEIYTLSLHDALPICMQNDVLLGQAPEHSNDFPLNGGLIGLNLTTVKIGADRKSTRLNSSHSQISYAVFCLKKNNAVQTRARVIAPGVHRNHLVYAPV